MDALDQLKRKWSTQHDAGKTKGYGPENITRAIRQRVHKHTREPMKYFWASLVLQVIVYALYAHVLVRFINDPVAVALAAVGILIYIPFTYVLMRKFKRLAVLKPDNNGTPSILQYVGTQRFLLLEFFRFKRHYELFLIPLSSLLGTLLVFKLYVPGGPLAYPNGVMITLALTLLSCYLAIRAENQRSFRTPLAALESLLNEFNEIPESRLP
jgi:hypothetical protein